MSGNRYTCSKCYERTTSLHKSGQCEDCRTITCRICGKESIMFNVGETKCAGCRGAGRGLERTGQNWGATTTYERVKFRQERAR